MEKILEKKKENRKKTRKKEQEDIAEFKKDEEKPLQEGLERESEETASKSKHLNSIQKDKKSPHSSSEDKTSAVLPVAEKRDKLRRKNYSKYDFVKIRVKLQQHHYIFSRFLVSRILTLIKVKERDAIKITLNLKKFLTEENLLNINQAELNEYLFKIMHSFGYNELYSDRYHMINRFYQQRIPLAILVSGTRCIGKSTIVTQLGEKINISNVLQTNIVYDMMHSLGIKHHTDLEKHVNFFDHNQQCSDEKFIKLYNKQCKNVRKGANFDIQKCLSEGKALIIEGLHVHPLYYIDIGEGAYGKNSILGNLLNSPNSDKNIKKIKNLEQMPNLAFERETTKKDPKKKGKKVQFITPEPTTFDEMLKEQEPERQMRTELRRIDQKQAIAIPFLLTLDSNSHYICIENRLTQLHLDSITSVPEQNTLKLKKAEENSKRAPLSPSKMDSSGNGRKKAIGEIDKGEIVKEEKKKPIRNIGGEKKPEGEIEEVKELKELKEDGKIKNYNGFKNKGLFELEEERVKNILEQELGDSIENKIKLLLNNYQKIQKYLLTVSQDVNVIKVNINDFDETLEKMHAIILETIEEAYHRKDFT